MGSGSIVIVDEDMLLELYADPFINRNGSAPTSSPSWTHN
jgi:hypothetical protein